MDESSEDEHLLKLAEKVLLIRIAIQELGVSQGGPQIF